MLSTNIFYSGYNILFGILSLFIGAGSVFLVRDSRDFRGLLFFQLGGLCMFFVTYLATNEHILYRVGLNFNFVILIRVLLSLLISVLWLNSASELYSGKLANREALTMYVSICLMICVYYSFIAYNYASASAVSSIITIFTLSFLLLVVVIRCIRSMDVGNVLLFTAVLILWCKLLVSTYFSRYNWLNLNLFNWLWIYVFTAAVVFMRLAQQAFELQKSWNTIDKLNLQFSNMIDYSPFPILISKITGDRLLMINNRAGTLFGITKKEVIYHKLNDLFVDEANREKFFSILEKEHEVQDFDLMVCNIVNATPFWLSVSAKTIEYNNEMAIYMAFQDITTRKEREKNLQNQADKDPLTRAWNRRYFEKFIPEKIEESIRNSKLFSLLMLDADKFKHINDTYGHKNGDKVLIELAEICRNSLREGDVVCRFGGEEFVIYLNNTDTKSAHSVAERLRKNIAQAVVKSDEGDDISFTVSVGVVSSEKTSSLDVLLRQVDDAMYIAKKNGRNRTEIYDESAVKKVMSKKTATKNRNVHPVFQNEDAEEISLLDSYDKFL